MLTLQDLKEMFYEHLDSAQDSIIIEDIPFLPSEVLEKFDNAFEQAFEAYLGVIEAEWVQTEEDGYYKLKNMFEEI